MDEAIFVRVLLLLATPSSIRSSCLNRRPWENLKRKNIPKRKYNWWVISGPVAHRPEACTTKEAQHGQALCSPSSSTKPQVQVGNMVLRSWLSAQFVKLVCACSHQRGRLALHDSTSARNWSTTGWLQRLLLINDSSCASFKYEALFIWPKLTRATSNVNQKSNCVLYCYIHHWSQL